MTRAVRASLPRSVRRDSGPLAYSHVTVDFSQGAIAALVPFLVLERGWTYAAAAGIVLAFSLVSSVVQPLFGILGDIWEMRWLIPVSVLLAGAGIAAIGLSDSFWFTALVAAASGIGVAAFHPAGASRARQISGGEHVMMSWFSLGGNIGFALAPLAVAASVGRPGSRRQPPAAGPRSDRRPRCCPHRARSRVAGHGREAPRGDRSGRLACVQPVVGGDRLPLGRLHRHGLVHRPVHASGAWRE